MIQIQNQSRNLKKTMQRRSQPSRMNSLFYLLVSLVAIFESTLIAIASVWRFSRRRKTKEVSIIMTTDERFWLKLSVLEAVLRDLVIGYDATEIKRIIHAMAEEEDDKKKHNNKTI